MRNARSHHGASLRSEVSTWYQLRLFGTSESYVVVSSL